MSTRAEAWVAEWAPQRAGRPWAPTKSGDGGVIHARAGMGRRSAPSRLPLENEREVLVADAAAAMVPTADPFDRAHAVRGVDGLLRPAAVELDGRVLVAVRHARPRRYPRAQTVTRYGAGGRPVVLGADSAFDDLYRRAEELARSGVGEFAEALGAIRVGERCAGMPEGVGGRSRRRVHCRLTAEEARLEAEADRLLACAQAKNASRGRGGTYALTVSGISGQRAEV